MKTKRHRHQSWVAYMHARGWTTIFNMAEYLHPRCVRCGRFMKTRVRGEF